MCVFYIYGWGIFTLISCITVHLYIMCKWTIYINIYIYILKIKCSFTMYYVKMDPYTRNKGKNTPPPSYNVERVAGSSPAVDRIIYFASRRIVKEKRHHTVSAINSNIPSLFVENSTGASPTYLIIHFSAEQKNQ